MSRPGDGLRRLATQICSDRTRRRLIDPAVADLQAEVGAARRTGSAWRTLRATAVGYLSIAKVLVLAVCGDLRYEASTWQPAERAGARRGAFVTIGATVVATGLFVVPIVDNFAVANPTMLGLYVTPSALAVTLPLGLLLGMAWTFHGAARTRKLSMAALALTGVCSILLFVNLGWVAPEANQAFRVLAFDGARAAVNAEFPDYRGEPAPPLQRGINELPLPAMHARLSAARVSESPSETRALEVAFYRKFALAISPLPMAGVLLALAFRRRWGRGRLTAAAIAICVLYIFVNGVSELYGARLGVPTLAIGWSATALCAVAALLLTSSRPRAQA